MYVSNARNHVTESFCKPVECNKKTLSALHRENRGIQHIFWRFRHLNWQPGRLQRILPAIRDA